MRDRYCDEERAVSHDLLASGMVNSRGTPNKVARHRINSTCNQVSLARYGNNGYVICFCKKNPTNYLLIINDSLANMPKSSRSTCFEYISFSIKPFIECLSDPTFQSINKMS